MIGFGLLEHALIALALQTLIGMTTGRWWVGAALTSGYFVGREVSQAEYRWIEAFGGGLRANMPWDAVFDPRVWQTADQTADWLGPVAATLTTALIMSHRRRIDRGAGGETHRP